MQGVRPNVDHGARREQCVDSDLVTPLHQHALQIVAYRFVLSDVRVHVLETGSAGHFGHCHVDEVVGALHLRVNAHVEVRENLGGAVCNADVLVSEGQRGLLEVVLGDDECAPGGPQFGQGVGVDEERDADNADRQQHSDNGSVLLDALDVELDGVDCRRV